jgi:hypothetical protein
MVELGLASPVHLVGRAVAVAAAVTAWVRPRPRLSPSTVATPTPVPTRPHCGEKVALAGGGLRPTCARAKPWGTGLSTETRVCVDSLLDPAVTVGVLTPVAVERQS